MPSFNRRSLIQTAGAVALAAMAKPAMAVPKWITEKPRFISDPFTLGVASGDPLPSGFVLWTRLAPDPLTAASAGNAPIPVRFEVAEDDRFRRVVKTGAAVAYPENGHSVHAEIQGLAAGRPFFYRFFAGDAVSPTGRALTAPHGPIDRFKLAFASCQQMEMGYFTAYRDMVAQDPDLIIHLGDYIYESTWNGPVRRAPVAEARTLDEYRRLHAAYKLDPDLQAAHRHTSWLFTWDDHEVVNDYAAEFDENYEPPEVFLKRRAAAYKAYYENLPLRASARAKGADMRLYQRLWFGDLLEINMLDTRQYRSDHPCQTPEEGGWQQIDANCEEALDPARSILGEEQERWLLGRVGRAGATWTVLAQGMLFATHDYLIGEGRRIGSEYWDGYVGSRDRVLQTLEGRAVNNPIIIGGDVHATYVNEVRRDHRNQASPIVASEFVTTSISSPNSWHDSNVATLVDNPHIKLYDGRYRGYTLCQIDHDKWVTDLRVVDDVTTQNMSARTTKRFVVEAGVAGPKEA